MHDCRWRCGPWCSGRRESVRARDRRVHSGSVPPAPGSGGMLVCSADGGVHRYRPSDVVIDVDRCQDGGEDPFPGAVHGPHLISRLCAVWNEPSSSGRSRQGEQVRHFQAMASRVRRCSAHRRPRTGSAGMSGSIRLHIASVITDRTGTSDQLTSPPKRHALGPRGCRRPG